MFSLCCIKHTHSFLQWKKSKFTLPRKREMGPGVMKSSRSNSLSELLKVDHVIAVSVAVEHSEQVPKLLLCVRRLRRQKLRRHQCDELRPPTDYCWYPPFDWSWLGFRPSDRRSKLSSNSVRLPSLFRSNERKISRYSAICSSSNFTTLCFLLISFIFLKE